MSTPVVVVHWDERKPMAMALQEMGDDYVGWPEQILRLAPVIPHEAVWEVVVWEGPMGPQTLHAVIERWKDRWLL